MYVIIASYECTWLTVSLSPGVVTVEEFRSIGFNNALEVQWNDEDTKCLIKAQYQ